ncbi:hypothetical protein [Rhizobium gallicum]|uniref:hypothetical protein n=1 Tax=Rhizobium gallicum TaxID=56730 RepID=UPI0012EC0829|nr:hypothetical protein [Rhizobium gallicum]
MADWNQMQGSVLGFSVIAICYPEDRSSYHVVEGFQRKRTVIEIAENIFALDEAMAAAERVINEFLQSFDQKAVRVHKISKDRCNILYRNIPLAMIERGDYGDFDIAYRGLLSAYDDVPTLSRAIDRVIAKMK